VQLLSVFSPNGGTVQESSNTSRDEPEHESAAKASEKRRRPLPTLRLDVLPFQICLGDSFPDTYYGSGAW
jgi:hypothetical protein